MGAIVKAIALSKPILNLFRKGALALESAAAKECLQMVNFNPQKLDVLINTGIYRDDHIIEPAAASLIQREVDANPLFDEKHKTFAFDLYNGPCGLITGIQLIDGYFLSGAANFGMVVAGDSNPRPGLEEGYDIEPLGGAVLLESGKEDKGFVKFKTDTYLQYKDDFTAKVKFAARGGKKTHVLLMKQSKDYLKKCVDCSVSSFKAFLKEAGIEENEIDLVITSQSPKGLIEAFSKKTGLGKKVVDVSKTWGNLHTVGPLAALSEAVDNGSFKSAKNTLFLTVGSGITVSIALYKN